MNVTAIIIAALVVGGTGIFLGFFLGIFGEKFKVEVDEREEAITGVLPDPGSSFREITAAAAGMQDAPALRQPLQKEKRP